MLRFYKKNIERSIHLNIEIASESIIFGENVWNDGKKYFRNYLCHDAAEVQMLPVENEDHETICYAWQDNEANRELRMLRELDENKEVLQFGEVFHGIREVVVCGCNELAYYFVKYLERQHIAVTVTGKYWEYFGYENDINVDLNGGDKLIIYAERTIPQTSDLYQTLIRSASSEFECIDKIYEENVQAGKIKDKEEDAASLWGKLSGKDIVILGTDAKSQDTYDLLYEHGIDICCFAEKNNKRAKFLLGKKIVGIEKLINNGKELVFISGHDKNSALGNDELELLDYQGYVRNKNFFLLNDYMDIPSSNLVHVLRNKNVRLAGDEKLCRLVSDYLQDVEWGEVDVKYTELSQCSKMKETDVLCIVNQWYAYEQFGDNPKVWSFREELSGMEDEISYTDYFSNPSALVKADLYLNRNNDKYSVKQLIPKGMLLGRIPYKSGNILFRGLLDGHPDIVKLDYGKINTNLFFYCIRLANEKPENIIKEFEEIFKIEQMIPSHVEMSNWGMLKKRLEDLLILKDRFSSQELFVLFHIAYTEMISGKTLSDISDKIIYWEPHHFPRTAIPFLALWLEDEKINGQTIYMHRDNSVWMGSSYIPYAKGQKEANSLEFVYCMARDDMVWEDDISYQNWKEFHVRFEDLKLHPKEELLKICDRLRITWSDTMLHTTKDGETWDYEGILDFDIKPVFNKYEEYLSAFDRFRILLISSPYQKKYGYVYESSMRFSRSELREMFLKPFKFQENLEFVDEKARILYQVRAYEILRMALWRVRKHEIMDDIIPLLDKLNIGSAVLKGKSQQKGSEQNRMPTQEELENLIDFVRRQEKLILYGIGKDCKTLLHYLGDNHPPLLFSDLKAEYMDITFYNSKVIPPTELSANYCDYHFLVTSSRHYRSIKKQLEGMGISPDRIICNTFQLWEDKK